MPHVTQFLADAVAALQRFDADAIERLIQELIALRERDGRLFVVGVGGSAANCTHAVNDFRKLAGIEAYTPVDNVAELTARTNDEGWDTVFAAWLRGSRISANDAVLVFSVGGGSREKNLSANIVAAVDLAKQVGAKVFGIVGRDGGHTARMADACVLVPAVNPATTTAHTEAFQAVVWHLITCDPRLMTVKNKWESLGV